jgi:hypothetical protein
MFTTVDYKRCTVNSQTAAAAAAPPVVFMQKK